VRLPVEGYGHVFLGGPGPVLAYRISPDTVRLSLDVPPSRMSLMAPPDMARELRHHYAPALPGDLRAAFLDPDCDQPRIRWAANRFRRRRFYGHGHIALVGDAVGIAHPLAAHGMTTAILDAECLARRGDVASYTRERRHRSWASERLGIALYRALADSGSLVLREALFHLWRHNQAQRDRMMRLLAVQEESRTRFGLAVARIGVTALTRTGEPDPGQLQRRSVALRCRATLDLANWLLWLYGPKAGIPPA
jgi:2-polyprenyl-6-methoxyphenol hydroxylase-like FAD-dependent oxidoreductase